MNTPPNLPRRRTLRHVAPFQLGKILGILYGALGLLLVPIFVLVSVLTPQLPPEQRGGMLAFGLGFAVLAPVIYAAMGFITGTLGAAAYNLISKWVGGIQVEIE